MGKDREGNFHPRKGDPTNSLTTTDKQTKEPVEHELYEDRSDIMEKYTVGDGEPAPNLLRHRNRNPDKHERVTDRGDNKTAKVRRDISGDTGSAMSSAEELSSQVTKETFSELAKHQGQNCISIYVQSHHKGAEVNELVDNTSFKNQLHQITSQLKQKNLDELQIEKLLAPSYELLRNDQFWREQSKGLAVFITEGSTQYMKLPFAPKQEELVVNTSYYLAPLTSMLARGDYFYLLTLSKNEAKLYRAGEYGIVELIIDEMPNGVDDVVHFEEKDDQKLFVLEAAEAAAVRLIMAQVRGNPMIRKTSPCILTK